MSIRTRTSGITFEVAPPPTAAGTPLDALIAGLAADGLTTKLDRLWIFAQATEAEALVDIIASATATAVNSPAFVANRGYTGSDSASPLPYIASNYNPTIDGTNYAANTAHVSMWSVTDIAATAGGYETGVSDTAPTGIVVTFSDGNAYLRINDGSGSQGAPATRAGHWIVTRDTSTTSQAYQNGLLFSSPNGVSAGTQNAQYYILASNIGGNASFGTPNQVAMISYGGSFTSTDAANFYNRLRTYMTAVGVP